MTAYTYSCCSNCGKYLFYEKRHWFEAHFAGGFEFIWNELRLIGSFFGISTISTFAESASGIDAGGRTGLTAITTGFFFLLCCFISPLFLMIPGAATGAALVIVGISLLETARALILHR